MHSNADVHDCKALNVSGRGETVRCVTCGCLPLVARASLTSALVCWCRGTCVVTRSHRRARASDANSVARAQTL